MSVYLHAYLWTLLFLFLIPDKFFFLFLSRTNTLIYVLDFIPSQQLNCLFSLYYFFFLFFAGLFLLACKNIFIIYQQQILALHLPSSPFCSWQETHFLKVCFIFLHSNSVLSAVRLKSKFILIILLNSSGQSHRWLSTLANPELMLSVCLYLSAYPWHTWSFPLYETLSLLWF